MGTARDEKRRLRLHAIVPKFNKVDTLSGSGDQLNDGQRALRVVCEEAFSNNVTAMARVLEMTPGNLRKYVVDGTQSPSWDLIERVAALVGLSGRQLLMVPDGGRDGVFIVGDDDVLDPHAITPDERLRLLRAFLQTDDDGPGGPGVQ